MFRLTSAALALILAASPLAADEFTDVVEGALEAYRDGDITIAREDLDYAIQLLGEMKAESLATFLPEAQAGWTREDADSEGSGFAMAMLGGGTTAAATYRNGAEELTITLVANSPMVGTIGAMVSGMASMGGGRPIRIQRTQFGNNDGEMQGVVDGKVLITVSGNAPVEAKTAHLEAMDFGALGDF